MADESIDESVCYVCVKEIKEEEEDWTTCDNCDIRFHLKCNNITKTACNAQRSNKCVLIFCPDCIDNRSNGADERMKIVQRLLFKLDMFNQQNNPQNVINSNSIKTIGAKLEELDKKSAI